MCPKCGKENPTPERSMCPDCAARNSELRKQNRKYHERIGICTHCGKNPAEPNKKLCYECLGQFQDSYSEKGKTDEQKEKDRLRKRQLKQTRIENGLCPKCGKHQSQNGGLCQRCRAYLKNGGNEAEIMLLIQRHLTPVRPNRKYPINLRSKRNRDFMYRVA